MPRFVCRMSHVRRLECVGRCWRNVAGRLGSHRRFGRMYGRGSLPLYWRNLGLRRGGDGGCLRHHRFYRSSKGIGCRRGGCTCCGDRRSDGTATEQRIVRVEFRLLQAMAREQHVIRIGINAACAEQYVIRVIHALTGEQRFVGFAPHRIGKLFGHALLACQRTAQNTRPARLFFLNRKIVLFLVVILVFFVLVILPGVIPAGTVAGEGQYAEHDATNFFRDADPGPAGEQRQARRPDAEQCNGAASAVEQRHHSGTQQAADDPARGKIPDIVGVDGGQATRGQDQRQNANQTQGNGEIVDVIFIGAVAIREPAATDDHHRYGVGHYPKNKEQGIGKPCARPTAEVVNRLVPRGLRPAGIGWIKTE